jgi:ribulose-bisphosphate carboxylase small chain
MRITQGTFSYLPDLTDEQIKAQVQYCINNGWAVSVEHTDDPHPRNIYWELFGLPIFDRTDTAEVMARLDECRRTFPRHYIKINAYDSSKGRETVALSFIVNRPPHEPGFTLVREEGPGRTVRYAIRSYAADRPEGERYR